MNESVERIPVCARGLPDIEVWSYFADFSVDEFVDIFFGNSSLATFSLPFGFIFVVVVHSKANRAENNVRTLQDDMLP
jgi:uncharacterized membrane protein YeiB